MAQRTQNRLDVSPIRRQRNRQFSQIRNDHSQRPKTSNATSRMTPTPIQDSRQSNLKISQFAHNKSQIEHNKSQISYSPQKTLCVGCFNKQLHQARQRKKKQDNQMERHPTSLSLINIDDDYHNQAKSRYTKQMELANQYNREKMLRDKEKRERERLQKQKGDLETRQTIEQNKQLQKRKAERQHDMVQQLRRQLQQQIQLKKQKQEQYKNQQKEPLSAIFGQPGRENIQHEIQQKYRRDLKNQIEQNRQLRQLQMEEENKRKKQHELRIFQQAAERQRIRKQQQERRQRAIEQDANRQKKYQQIREEKKKNEEVEEENEVKNKYNAYIEEKKHIEDARKKKLERYVDDLKKQMAIDEAKKKRQYAWLHQPTRSALIQKQSIPERTCDSCQKKYPEPYLTKLNQPLKF